MTPRGLIKLTAAANRIEAMRDWERVARSAEERGYGNLVIKFAPSGNAGWRKIDKARHALEAALQEPQP